MSNMEVANTIHQQLGGREFSLCVGLKRMVYSEKTATFHIGTNPKRIKAVRVEYDYQQDLYSIVSFKAPKKGALEILEAERHDGIDCSMLKDLFESMTALYVSVGRRR